MTNYKIASLYKPDGKDKKMFDQYFLKHYFYKLAIHNATIHDSYHCKRLGGDPFPIQRPIYECYVACMNCCNSTYTQKIWKYVCPKECRPKNHLDWKYC